jgi:non-ribosomal peptide synthetase component E (peptide arylation enzyme)
MAKATRYTKELIDEYTAKGYWKSTTLCELWDRNAGSFPDEEAIVDSKVRLTWSQAKQWIDRLALGFIELGIRRDDAIVMQLPPMVENLLLRVACEKAGILCLPAARTLRHAEMQHILNRLKPAGLVILPEFAGFGYLKMLEEIRPSIPKIPHIFVIGEKVPQGTASLEDLIEQPLEKKHPAAWFEGRTFSAFETSLILHTTGTTGMPKLVENAMCAQLWRGESYIKLLGLTTEDTIGMFAPVAGGPNGPVFFTAPRVPAKVAILEKWETEEALKLIQREKVTTGFLVPTMLINMIRHPDFDSYDVSSLRVVWTGGAPISYHQALEVEKKLGCPLLQHYGSIDADICTISAPEDAPEIRLFTVGKPLASPEIKLVDEEGREVGKGETGEVWGQGPASTPGYYGDEEATRQAWEGGWFKMGDLARWDDEGNLVIVGRKKDLIIRGGQNIYPVEVENSLRTHPKVLDAAIVGMPDPIMGQKCCAFVVLRERETFPFEEMVGFLKEKKFAPYKLPERLEFVECLPRVGDQQKVDKKVLEQRITEKLKSEGGMGAGQVDEAKAGTIIGCS